jgi:hypothetical protein
VAGNAVSISPDGSLVAYGQMAPYGATVLEFATLGPNNQMMTGPYPSAVQFSHSGSMLAVGLQAPYGTSTVQVFSMPDAVIQAGSLAQGPGMSYPATAVSMNFATDDSVIYTLLHDTYGAGEDYYMVAPTTPTASPSPTPSASPSPTTSPSPTASPSATPTPSTTPTPTSSPTPTRTPLALSLEIGTVTRPGRDLTMQATLPGRPGVRINFTVSDPGLGDRRIQASTDARGVATASMPVWYSGTANASVDYTENLTVAGAATDFWVPAVAEVNTTGNYKFINGVRYFHRLKDTVVFARAYPGHVSWVKAFLLRKDDGVWRLIGTRFWTTDSTGRVRLSFDNLRHGAVYEQVIEIQGSAYNNPSARVGVSFVVK